MKYTTLNEIKKHEPCSDGWQKLLTALGKTKADDEPVSLKFILESNGLDDALWALRGVADIDRDALLFAVWCARQVQHLMTDQRSLDALDVAERFANGEATQDELDAAWAAARAASRAAAMAAAWYAAWAAAMAAAWYAARDAAMAAAWYAARDAARAAAWYAARDAAMAAAWAAARATARAAQKAKFIEMFCKEDV